MSSKTEYIRLKVKFKKSAEIQWIFFNTLMFGGYLWFEPRFNLIHLPQRNYSLLLLNDQRNYVCKL